MFTTPETFGAVKDGLAAHDFVPAHAEVGLMPETRSPLTEADAEKFLQLIDALEELDDVQEVYHNADIADDILERIS